MQIIDIHQAKTHFSKLIEKAIEGHEIIIAKAGKPIAMLVPYPKSTPRHFGILKSKITVRADFDTPLPEGILADFEE